MGTSRILADSRRLALVGILLGACGGDKATPTPQANAGGSGSPNGGTENTAGESSGPDSSQGGSAGTTMGGAGAAAASGGSAGDQQDGSGTSAGAGGDGTAGGAGGAGTAGGDGGAGTAGTAGTAGDGGTAGAAGGAAGSDGAAGGANDDGAMSFFVTSRGAPSGGDLGGLDGADAFCQELAEAVGSTKMWRAYLSTQSADARDRIGTGPWRNHAGVVIARDPTQLHDQAAGGALDETWPPTDLNVALDENGDTLANSVHDILTGSQEDGTLAVDATCQDWTSSSSSDVAQVGHSNRDGGGLPPSFSTTHTVGCAPSDANYAQGTVTQGGGRGSLYCFAP